MMKKTPIETQQAPPAIGPYSQAIQSGNLVFCSGQIAIDPSSPQSPMPQSLVEQTKRVLSNIEAILRAADCSPKDIVKSTIFLTDMKDFSVVNEIYGAWCPKPYPARSTVAVKELPRQALVEIEVIAIKNH